MVRLAGLRSYARLAREKLGNQLTAGRFAGEVTVNGPVPDEAVALFFAVGPENAYQFEQWRAPLEALATRRPVVVIVCVLFGLVLGATPIGDALYAGVAALGAWLSDAVTGL